jgi:hypothetical protein
MQDPRAGRGSSYLAGHRLQQVPSGQQDIYGEYGYSDIPQVILFEIQAKPDQQGKEHFRYPEGIDLFPVELQVLYIDIEHIE